MRTPGAPSCATPRCRCSFSRPGAGSGSGGGRSFRLWGRCSALNLAQPADIPAAPVLRPLDVAERPRRARLAQPGRGAGPGPPPPGSQRPLGGQRHRRALRRQGAYPCSSPGRRSSARRSSIWANSGSSTGWSGSVATCAIRLRWKGNNGERNKKIGFRLTEEIQIERVVTSARMWHHPGSIPCMQIEHDIGTIESLRGRALLKELDREVRQSGHGAQTRPPPPFRPREPGIA